MDNSPKPRKPQNGATLTGMSPTVVITVSRKMVAEQATPENEQKKQ